MNELFLELDKIIFEEQMYDQYGFMDDSEISEKETKRRTLLNKLYANNLSEKEIEENIDYINFIVWKQIWSYKKCSEEFMEKHIEHINMYAWYEILTLNNNLSEKFIEKHTDDNVKMYWDEICEWQKLSKSFMRKHIDKLSIEALQKNTFINQDDMDDIYVALSLLGRP
jgi:hypothetical protein